MICVTCKTNLDLFNEEWPSYLPAVPRVGDLIRSKTKRVRGFQLTLKVVSVTWIFNEIDGCWTPEIELHIRQEGWSIRDFFNWYAPAIGKSPGYFI